MIFAGIDAENLPFADASVDIVYGYAFVHHLPDLDRFLAETARVLRPGGRAVFLDAAYAPLWDGSKRTWLHGAARDSPTRSTRFPLRISGSPCRAGFASSPTCGTADPALRRSTDWFERSGCFHYLAVRASEYFREGSSPDLTWSARMDPHIEPRGRLLTGLAPPASPIFDAARLDPGIAVSGRRGQPGPARLGLRPARHRRRPLTVGPHTASPGHVVAPFIRGYRGTSQAVLGRVSARLSRLGSSHWQPEFFSTLERERYLLEPDIQEFAAFESWGDKDVLEGGCGIATDGLQFARAGARYTGIDFSPTALDLARRRFDLEGAAGRFIPAP